MAVTLLTLFALGAGFMWLSRWSEIPADYQHPSEFMPYGCYDGQNDEDEE